jgi:hypothetical protein
MRIATRTKTTTEPQLELFTVNALRIPIYESTHPIRPDGRATLAGVPAEDGHGTRSAEPAPRDAAGGGGADGNGTGRDSPEADASGIDGATGPRPGLGNGAGAIHLPDTGVVAGDAEVDAESNCISDEPEPPRNRNNFRITYEDRIGLGTLKQKCRDNLGAIELLKSLEAENRPVTDDEKRVLVRYVGWGGLPQVFDSLNEQWKKEREKLESLLTDDELESARATTLNAHYTAPVIIRAMYGAL